MDASRAFAVEAARLAADTRCHNVALLDVTGISPVTDFLILATGTSPRQMRTACDEVEELGEKLGFKAFTRSGYEGETWIVYDFVNVVFHVFNQEARQFYDLDNLWGDGKAVEWRDAHHPAPAADGDAALAD